MHDGAQRADQRTKDSAGDGAAVTQRDPIRAVLDKVWCAAVDAALSPELAGDEARERYRGATLDAALQALRDRVETDPDVRWAATRAARNWALVNPIPAWGLAVGADAEKLADAWGAAVAERVLLAVADAIEAHSPAAAE